MPSSSLPPYSTFLTDSKQKIMFPQANSFGNILTFTPPGFKQSLNVKFPDSRLPVCVSCKKNYKTKDMCRVRNQHTSSPWTTAYICMSVDETCTDDDGNYVDQPFVIRMFQGRPYCVTEDFAPKSKTPVCATCKKTNRTRSFCRDRHKHRNLPWCTVYVLLSTHESVDPSTVVAPPSIPVEAKMTAIDSTVTNVDSMKKEKPSQERNIRHNINQNTIQNELFVLSPSDTQRLLETMMQPLDESKMSYTPREGLSNNDKNRFSTKERDVNNDIPEVSPSEQGKRSSTKEGDDINNIPESRTMLIKVSDKETTTISWLELLHDDDIAVKGLWQPLLPQQRYLPNHSLSSVATAAGRDQKRNIELVLPIQAQPDVHHQYAISEYSNTTRKPLYRAARKGNEPPQQQYIYPVPVPRRHDVPAPSFHNSNSWQYPTTASVTLPPQHYVLQPVPNPYLGAASMHQRPISPVPIIGSSGGSIVSVSSPSITAGEAAARQRKKKRREVEIDDHPELQPPDPSPVPPPAITLPQLQYSIVDHGEVASGSLSPGPSQQQLRVQQHFPLQQPTQQEHQSWMIYQQMYQAQLLPINTQFSNDTSRINIGTPENISRSFRHNDESPNNVTTTPVSGEGADHDENSESNRSA